MKLKSLKLINYRNCENVELNFCDFKNLIIGKNAQGKTNILESIYFLSNLKSVRTSNNLDLIFFDKPQMEISAILEAGLSLWHNNNTDNPMNQNILENEVISNG